METFSYGNFIYNYELVRQSRKTLSLTVKPDKSIILKCPHEADENRINNFLEKKWLWLEKQLRYFSKYQRKSYTKEYITGESFLYLGRQYTLKVEKAYEARVVIFRGNIVLYTPKNVLNGTYNKKVLEEWFIARAEFVFNERLEEVLKLFNFVTKPKLGIREMKKRWGSFLTNKKVLLNPKLIHASKDCIDYVIVHELCHFTIKNHSKEFFDLLESKYPKWKEVKEKLELFPIQ